jgi:tetratricopeptide (TPR) repeat protein
MGQISNAVGSFEKALQIQPRYPEVYYNMGRAFLANHQPDVAAEAFRSALAQDASVADTHFNYANALEQLGRNAEAITEYSKAVELSHAQNPAMLGALAEAYAKSGKLAEAAATARQAIQLAHLQNNGALETMLETRLRKYEGR